MNYLFTSESVTSGHPDKICDSIADHILDEALKQDPSSKMAVEATIKDDLIFLYGEANTKAIIDYQQIALDVLKNIGYDEEYTCITKINGQSAEINHAVNDDMGAGDQGMMFGYASDETETYMPAAIYYAHALAKQLEVARRNNNQLKPDGKTQVTVEYENDAIKRIDTIVVSCQHSATLTQEELRNYIISSVINTVIPSHLMDENTRLLINPSGSFITGGSFGDSGTTGRKIVVDSYGGYAPIGGGCFSSKDPSKVDRSGAYYARYVAKNLVANGICKKVLIEVSYAIGMAKPLSLYVNTYQTSSYSQEEILQIINDNFDFSVNAMIHELNLRTPFYSQTTNYGHFGKEDLPYEKIKKLKVNN